jgi:TolB-like protein
MAAAAMLIVVPVGVVTLTKLSTPSTPGRSVNAGVIRSIAVLPLRNISKNADQEKFADGMTEALTTSLSQINALTVVPSTSALPYRGTTKSLRDIGRELSVDAIVQGSVQLSGGRMAITVQLVDAASGRNLWTKSYDRELRDLPALQIDVAQTIAQEIRVKLSSQEQVQ